MQPSSARTRDELILSCLRLAAKIANHHIRRANSRRAYAEDIHATAIEGLVRAARGYDPSRGVPFPSYARRRIEGAVLDLFRERDHLSRHYRSVAKASGEEAWATPVSLEVIENWEERFTDTGSSPEDEAADSRMVDMVDVAAKNLPPRTREVLRLYYAEDRTQKQIGVRLGLTETRICQILRAAHEAIRAKIGEPPTWTVARSLPLPGQ